MNSEFQVQSTAARPINVLRSIARLIEDAEKELYKTGLVQGAAPQVLEVAITSGMHEFFVDSNYVCLTEQHPFRIRGVDVVIDDTLTVNYAVRHKEQKV